jgi:hypothetical protein
MGQVTPYAAPRFLGPEFNQFLFAMVGTDRLGGQLSVVSALARLDLDAWAEAAALAGLPRDAAVIKLSGMLRRNSEIPQIGQEAGAIAARLVALLPGGTVPVRKLPAAGWTGASTPIAVCLLVALVVMISLQFVTPTPHRHAAPGGPAITEVTQTPPPP